MFCTLTGAMATQIYTCDKAAETKPTVEWMLVKSWTLPDMDRLVPVPGSRLWHGPWLLKMVSGVRAVKGRRDLLNLTTACEQLVISKVPHQLMIRNRNQRQTQPSWLQSKCLCFDKGYLPKSDTMSDVKSDCRERCLQGCEVQTPTTGKRESRGKLGGWRDCEELWAGETSFIPQHIGC